MFKVGDNVRLTSVDSADKIEDLQVGDVGTVVRVASYNVAVDFKNVKEWPCTLEQLEAVVEPSFKVGDRVILVDDEDLWWDGRPKRYSKGDIGTVKWSNKTMTYVCFDNGTQDSCYTKRFSLYKQESITFNTYQSLARVTANTNGRGRDRLCNWSMGLSGETGELVDMFKKHIFHDHIIDPNDIKKELGDILWYVANIAKEFGIDLEDVADLNIAKLKERYPEGFSSAASVGRKENS